MVEQARYLDLALDTEEAEYKAPERQEYIRRVFDQSRVGPYAVPDLLKQNLEPVGREIKAEGLLSGLKESKARAVATLRGDIAERIELICEGGEDSIGHLPISFGTINTIMRLNHVVVGIDLKKISSWETIFGGEKIGVLVVLPEGEEFLSIRMSKANLQDLKQEMKNFQLRKAQVTAPLTS